MFWLQDWVLSAWRVQALEKCGDTVTGADRCRRAKSCFRDSPASPSVSDKTAS
jgi:hypothetical protein